MDWCSDFQSHVQCVKVIDRVKIGSLVYKNDLYVCEGFVSSWTVCWYRTMLPERTKLKIPEDDVWEAVKTILKKQK